MILNAYLFLAVFLSFFVKGITGFGNTLVMAPLFSFVIPNKTTTPIDLLMSVPTNAYLAWRERKAINPKIVIPLSLMLLAGVIPGTFLLKTGEDWLLKGFLGLVVIGIGIEMLTRKTSRMEPGKGNAVFLTFIGILSGMLAGLYGISAPLVAYISRTTGNRSEFRANICCVFFIENVFRLAYYIISGILTKAILLKFLMLSPAVALGLYAGIRIDKKLTEDTVKKAMVYLLIASGAVLFINNVLIR